MNQAEIAAGRSAMLADRFPNTFAHANAIYERNAKDKGDSWQELPLDYLLRKKQEEDTELDKALWFRKKARSDLIFKQFLQDAFDEACDCLLMDLMIAERLAELLENESQENRGEDA